MDREEFEREVAERLLHDSDEDVRTTLSFAQAERLFGKEYHGRFLIELLQNAADAWRSDPRSGIGGSRVSIVLTDEPALLVANEGVPISADVIVGSLGHIGASNKPEGEAIGHKGIGFKSVLELSRSPEIYSGFGDGVPEVAVRFDPSRALDEIKSNSTAWGNYFADREKFGATGGGVDALRIPVLRYPFWVNDLPVAAQQLASGGFDTVIRLPFEPTPSVESRYHREKWIDAVQTAMADVTDEIFVLLDCFSEVTLEDRIAGTTQRIKPNAIALPTSSGTPERIEVLRNDLVTSEWLMFRDVTDTGGELRSEIAVGVRLTSNDGYTDVASAQHGHSAAPFHLFFPTQIESGTPFLLHGYFKVDAARTGFYRGAYEENRLIIEALAALAAHAVEFVADQEDMLLVGLVDLMAASSEPEDALARHFRATLLDHLDGVAWIPTAEGAGRRAVPPADALVAPPRIVHSIHDAFPAPYVGERTSRELPHPRLSYQAIELLAKRTSEDGVPWEVIGDLCRPGDIPLWNQGEEAVRFKAFLRLVDSLRAESEEETSELLAGLQGDPDARLIPSVSADGGCALLPVPNPAEGSAGDRSRMVMARVRTSGADLVPPDSLDLAFLPGGLLDNESEIDRARPLGVRPFTVNNVLDRLNGVADSSAEPAELLSFLWRLLSREPVGSFATRTTASRATDFAPGQWFWCRPGRAADDDNERLQQQRERYLAEVRVPCQDGNWRPAGTVAFGEEWADWLFSGACPTMPASAREHRVSAYRALDAVGSGLQHFLASPSVVFEHFEKTLHSGSDGQAVDPDADLARLGFLLRLGVWEVFPVEAFESRSRANRERFPWSGPAASQQLAEVQAAAGWTFDTDGWMGERHHNVYLAEDYRFMWSLEESALRDPVALTHLLDLGADLYGHRCHAVVFCGSCSDNGGTHRATRQSSAADGYPSVLAVELNHSAWVPCTVDGQVTAGPIAPNRAWWHRRPPEGSGLRQSPWRMLPLCGPPTGVTERLHRLAGINALDDAPPDVVTNLLRQLRDDFEANSLPVDPMSSGSARQAFIGLHRLAYGRLGELHVSGEVEAKAIIDEVGALCELGDRLTYRPRSDARQDDGRYASYVRHFVGMVPFVVLQRTDEALASRLGIEKVRIRVERRGDDEGVDVTDDLHDMLADRVPELLAIVVNHSLGTDTLELTSTRFDERARRLQNLRVRQVGDLIVDASVEETSLSVTIGHGADRDVLLDQPVSTTPVIYHDFTGVGWQERFRKKLAPMLAAMLENGAYAHTLALFLQQETDAEREEFLLELGISHDEVDAVATRVGVAGVEEQARQRRWYLAVAAVLGTGPTEPDVDPGVLLARSTLPPAAVEALLNAGGGEWSRRDASPESPAAILQLHGVDLQALDDELRLRDDSGLALGVGRQRFRTFVDVHARRLVAVVQCIRPSTDVATVKRAVAALQPSPRLRVQLDPPMAEIVEPVIEFLGTPAEPFEPSRWATEAAVVLAELGGFGSVEELDEQAERWFDDEERAHYLRQQATLWRRDIRLLAVLARTAPTDTLATIRRLDEETDRRVDSRPASPAALVEAVQELLAEVPALTDWLVAELSAPMSSPPQRDELLQIAEGFGLDTTVVPNVQRALDAPRRDHALKVRRRVNALVEADLSPSRPRGLRAIGPVVPPTLRTKIPKIKVDPSSDRRKRQAGDEGEEWALAAVIRELLDATLEERNAAIDEIEQFVEDIGDGEVVEAALAHAASARRPDLDDDELVDELTGLVHLSRHSDAFGMDMVGWLPVEPGGPRRAIGLEVKSSGGESFNLSLGEWRRAEAFHANGNGDRYAVLVVRRSKSGGPPSAMDLLTDPVALLAAHEIHRDVDGYQVKYSSE